MGHAVGHAAVGHAVGHAVGNAVGNASGAGGIGGGAANDRISAGLDGLRSMLGGGVSATAQPAGGSSSSSDARVLPPKFDSDGSRYRDFQDAVLACKESHFEDWVVPGPRSAPWVNRFLSKRSGAMAHDSKWAHETKLPPENADRQLHNFISKLYTTALEYDQYDTTNSATFELMLRELQVIEERHKDKLLVGGADHLDRQQEYNILMNTTGDSAHCMCPALKEYLASEVGKQMVIDKERRKAREERELARTRKPPKGGPKGAGGDGS